MKNTHGKHTAKISEIDKKSFFESKGYTVIRSGYKYDLICPEGHECKIRYNDFKNSGLRCQSYGKSSSETIIKEYLQRYRINAIRQYTFNDCRDLGELEFDFALIKDNKAIAIIEYDGECHYRAKSKYGGIRGLLEHQRRDKIKTEYCRANEIALIRIPYWQRENIDEILDEWLINKI